MRIVFAGGGTAGHINPAVAVANYIRQKEQDSEILFIGTEEGMEKSLIPQNGYAISFIRVHGFSREISLSNIKNIFETLRSIGSAKKILKEFRPDIVIGTGGYVSGPVIYAAAKLGFPTLIHESNAYPGLTTKICARYADITALGMSAAKERLPKARRIEVTGNPVRPSILQMPSSEARRKLKLDERPFLFFVGGSLGAAHFNRVVTEWICTEGLSGKYQILMGTGRNNQFDEVLHQFRAFSAEPEQYPHIQVREYVYDMDAVLNAADVIVSRAGASTLSEITALGKASILVPSPYVTENHQEHNARFLERRGGCRVITEAELTRESLQKNLQEILTQKNILDNMRKASKSVGVTDTSDKIYRLCKTLIKSD